jgi:hypothetical protein
MVADTTQPPSIRSSPETSTPRPGVHSLFALMRYQHIILAKPQIVRQRCMGQSHTDCARPTWRGESRIGAS